MKKQKNENAGLYEAIVQGMKEYNKNAKIKHCHRLISTMAVAYVVKELRKHKIEKAEIVFALNLAIDKLK